MFHSDESARTNLNAILEATYAQVEQAVRQHASPDHPDLECQCLECLYAREMASQLQALKHVH